MRSRAMLPAAWTIAALAACGGAPCASAGAVAARPALAVNSQPAFAAQPVLAAQPAPAPAAAVDARQERLALISALDEAYRDGDDQALLDAMLRAWEVDAKWSRERAWDLLNDRLAARRAVAVRVLKEHGTADELAQSARALNARDFPDERRMLVRWMGQKDPERAWAELPAFLDDRDEMVRLAAINALADLNRPDAVGLVLRFLTMDPPVQRQGRGGDSAFLLATAAYGLVHRVTDVRPTSPREVRDWWRNNGPNPAPVERPTPEAFMAENRAARHEGFTLLSTPNFDVGWRFAGQEGPPTGGFLAWPRFGAMVEETAARAMENAEGIFGPTRLPHFRVYVAEPRLATALGVAPGFGGKQQSYGYVVRAEMEERMYPVMVHEFVHLIHNTQFERVPRWLAEGLGESLTMSPRESVWTMARAQRLGIVREVERGAASIIAQWDAGASSDEREVMRYATAHLLIDYLRYGGFAAADERMYMLLGRLSRREPTQRAIEDVYGMSLRELDDAVRAWVRAR